MADRIATLSASLADQIAAGEVVERPASVLKELLENAVDAAATRVQIESQEGGARLIRVVDDGRGIHPDDMGLALTRHATSKLHRPEQLIELETLGFRGEALASIAAVARVRLRSRQAGSSLGRELSSVPGQALEQGPVGMPEGTQVDVEHLFAAIPARRKFLRAEATEVGHCVDAVIRVALVHPEVEISLQHGSRQLLRFPRADLRRRVEQVLERRAPGPYFEIQGEHEGTKVQAWLGTPQRATRQRNGVYILVRRRVVKERNLSQILSSAYADTLPSGSHPVAYLNVEPPRGTVDVNVHPQKSEVRFSDPQSVYAAVREIMNAGLRGAEWLETPGGSAESPPSPSSAGESLAQWSHLSHTSGALTLQLPEPAPTRASEGGARYRLGTRALGGDYARDKQNLRQEARALGERLAREKDSARRPASFPGPGPATGQHGFADNASLPAMRHEPVEPGSAREPSSERPSLTSPSAVLLTCLSGTVALFEYAGELLVVDLLRLREHLVYRRLARDLDQARPGTGVSAQVLVEPKIVRLEPLQLELCRDGQAALRELGIVTELFGDDALMVRAVPAALQGCVEGEEIKALVLRLMPWLRMKVRQPKEALTAIAGGGASPAPRLARRWLAELMEVEGWEELEGIRRWSAPVLCGREER